MTIAARDTSDTSDSSAVIIVIYSSADCCSDTSLAVRGESLVKDNIQPWVADPPG